MAFEPENAIAPRFLTTRSRLSDQGLAPLAIECHRSAIQDSRMGPLSRPVKRAILHITCLLSGSECRNFKRIDRIVFRAIGTIALLTTWSGRSVTSPIADVGTRSFALPWSLG